MSVAAFHHHRLLRAEIAVWPELTEKGLAQGLSFLISAVQPLIAVPDNFTGVSVAKPKATKKDRS
jgi:hypothetical protein